MGPRGYDGPLDPMEDAPELDDPMPRGMDLSPRSSTHEEYLEEEEEELQEEEEILEEEPPLDELQEEEQEGRQSRHSQRRSRQQSADEPQTRPSKVSLMTDISHTQYQNGISICQVLQLLLAALVPNILMVGMCSYAFLGMDLYTTTASKMMENAGNACMAVLFFWVMFLYIVDAGNWGRMGKFLAAFVIWGCIVLASIFRSHGYPWAPLLMFIAHIPLLVAVLRVTRLKLVRKRVFYIAFGLCALFVALVVAFFWCFWIYSENKGWDDATFDQMVIEAKEIYDYEYAERPLVWEQDCGPDKDLTGLSGTEKTDIGLACKSAHTILFMMWSAPLVGTMGTTVMGFMTIVHGLMLHAQGDGTPRIERALNQIVGLCALVLMGMYVSLSISGASVQLGSTLVAFFGAGIMVLCVWMYMEIGRQALTAQVKKSSVAQQIIKLYQSDWARAVILGGFNVALPIFLVLNMLKQKCRRCRRDPAADRSKEGRFTEDGEKLVAELRTWSWAAILVKICLLGELFFTFQVGVSKATYIFLSWLNVKLATWNYGLIIAVIFVIGYTMFLLPPVPGVPVYVFCGIVVAEQGRQIDGVGFLLGCAIAIFLAFFLKLAACTGQYYIGFFMGKSVKIQQLIGVDKVPTRAIEKILQKRGLSLGKVAVLVGGPDWPTSVTCGILRLSVPQMLVGTMPVITVSSPCVLAGAFLARVTVGEDSIWSAMASTSLVLAAAGQAGSMFTAVFCITQEINRSGTELAKPRKEHEAVEALTRAEARYNEILADALKWANLSTCLKLTIGIGAGAMLFSCFVFALLGEYCFRKFAVSSKIDAPYEENGLEGDALSIALPLGRANIGLFIIATCLHIFFTKATQRIAKRRLAAEGHQAPGTDPVERIVNSSGPGLHDFA